MSEAIIINYHPLVFPSEGQHRPFGMPLTPPPPLDQFLEVSSQGATYLRPKTPNVTTLPPPRRSKTMKPSKDMGVEAIRARRARLEDLTAKLRLPPLTPGGVEGGLGGGGTTTTSHLPPPQLSYSTSRLYRMRDRYCHQRRRDTIGSPHNSNDPAASFRSHSGRTRLPTLGLSQMTPYQDPLPSIGHEKILEEDETTLAARVDSPPPPSFETRVQVSKWVEQITNHNDEDESPRGLMTLEAAEDIQEDVEELKSEAVEIDGVSSCQTSVFSITSTFEEKDSVLEKIEDKIEDKTEDKIEDKTAYGTDEVEVWDSAKYMFKEDEETEKEEDEQKEEDDAKVDIKEDVEENAEEDAKEDAKENTKEDVKENVMEDAKEDAKEEMKVDMKEDIKEDMKEDMKELENSLDLNTEGLKEGHNIQNGLEQDYQYWIEAEVKNIEVKVIELLRKENPECLNQGVPRYPELELLGGSKINLHNNVVGMSDASSLKVGHILDDCEGTDVKKEDYEIEEIMHTFDKRDITESENFSVENVDENLVNIESFNQADQRREVSSGLKETLDTESLKIKPTIVVDHDDKVSELLNSNANEFIFTENSSNLSERIGHEDEEPKSTDLEPSCTNEMCTSNENLEDTNALVSEIVTLGTGNTYRTKPNIGWSEVGVLEGEETVTLASKTLEPDSLGSNLRIDLLGELESNESEVIVINADHPDNKKLEQSEDQSKKDDSDNHNLENENKSLNCADAAEGESSQTCDENAVNENTVKCWE